MTLGGTLLDNTERFKYLTIEENRKICLDFNKLSVKMQWLNFVHKSGFSRTNKVNLYFNCSNK